MLNHYLKIAIRNLFRNKIFSIINILGLALGMGAGLLIFQYISFELSYDTFHNNPKTIYRVTKEAKNDEDLGRGVYTTYALGQSSKEVISEVKDFVRVHSREFGLTVINSENNERYQEDFIWYVDSNFLQMFNFPLKYGNKKLALNEKHGIVITEKMAIKYFGDVNPLGKAIKVSGGSLSGDFVVTGVLKTLPVNSHLQFDFLLSMEFLLENWRMYKQENGWESENFVTYLALDKDANIDLLGKKLESIIATHSRKEVGQFNNKLKIGLQSLTDIHLRAGVSEDIGRNNGNIQNVQYFVIIAVFILLMAWINYINLSTAQAITRSKEVGVRKSIGADKKQLIVQFLIESGFLNFTAAILSIFIAHLLLPLLNNILGQEIEFNLVNTPEFWVTATFVVIFGTLVSGLYPAFVLSSFKPASIFKTVKIPIKAGFNLRKSLVVFQFIMSVILISGTYLVYQQISFMRSQHLGMDIKKIMVVKGPRVILETQKETLGSLYQTFKIEGVNHHSISTISATSQVPGKGFLWSGNFHVLGDPKNANKEASVVFVDTDFTSAYGMEFLAKRKFPDEVNPYEWLIINEETVKALGLASPEDALNEKILVFNDTLNILGVVKNLHWSSLRDPYTPVFFMLDNQYGAYFSIKMNIADIKESVNHIASAYHSVFPDDPFDYFFLEDDFNKQYQADLQFGKLFSLFSIMAVFIACLGLFALVSFSGMLRVKEIGIRKILGASVGNLMFLLFREYLGLLLIAVTLSIPIITFVAQIWLDNFAFKIDIGIEHLLIPSLILFLISLLTVIYQTYTTARTNPVKSLKSE